MWFQLMPMREGQPVYRDLRQIVEYGEPIMRRIVIRGSISYFDQKSSRFADEKRQEVVGSNQVRINGEAQYPEAVVQVVLPYGLVPIIWSPFQQFAAPDVVYEHIDVAVVFLNLLCQRFHLGGFEMINCGRDPR